VRFIVLLVIAPLALGTTSVVIFRTYQGTASLWVEAPNYLGQSVAPAGWNSYLTPAQNQADTLQQLLTTQSFDEQIGERLQATGVIRNSAERGSIVASIPTRMKVTPEGSHLISLTFSYETQAACVGVLKAAIDLFQERLTALQSEEQNLNITFLTGQLNTAQARLAKSEQALQQYLLEHPAIHLGLPGQDSGIVDLDQRVHQVQLDRDQATQLQNELDQARFLGAAAQKVVETNTKVVDQPSISKAGFIGDGSSLKRALLVWLLCASVGTAYLVVLVWIDKTARDSKELERRLLVPVVTTIPYIRLQERF
jgi:hypothetical protein